MLVFKYGLYMPIKIIDKARGSRIGASLFFSYVYCYLRYLQIPMKAYSIIYKSPNMSLADLCRQATTTLIFCGRTCRYINKTQALAIVASACDLFIDILKVIMLRGIDILSEYPEPIT